MTRQTELPPIEDELEPAPSGPWAAAREILNYRESGIFIALVVILTVMCIISPNFRTRFNLTVVTEQMATVAIMATGQTLVIISAAFDVSQAAICGLAAMTTGLLWAKGGLNPILAIVIGLATGATAGLLNGVLAARFKLHPIVMTLATSTIFLGCTYLITHGEPVIGLPPQLLWMGESFFGPIPVSVVIMLVVVAAMQILLTRTQFGLRVRQVGGNTEAARLTGVNVSMVILGVFVVSGLLAALGGAIEMGRGRQRDSDTRLDTVVSDHYRVDPWRHAPFRRRRVDDRDVARRGRSHGHQQRTRGAAGRPVLPRHRAGKLGRRSADR